MLPLSFESTLNPRGPREKQRGAKKRYRKLFLILQTVKKFFNLNYLRDETYSDSGSKGG